MWFWHSLFLFPVLWAAPEAPSNAERIRHLQESLLAPCCWSEPVSVHRSELAVHMRAEIARFVADGKSDREILDYYIGRHGLRVLLEPEGQRRVWLYLIPAAMSLAGLLLVAWIISRYARLGSETEPRP